LYRIDSNPVDYTFNRDDKCFINIAHKGADASHTMHVWLGYKDLQTNIIKDLVEEFGETWLERSTDNSLNNFRTCYFDELEIDLLDKPKSNKYLIGYSVQDSA
jgi:hypothetical protein